MSVLLPFIAPLILWMLPLSENITGEYYSIHQEVKDILKTTFEAQAFQESASLYPHLFFDAASTQLQC